jgi:hypothetical protein
MRKWTERIWPGARSIKARLWSVKSTECTLTGLAENAAAYQPLTVHGRESWRCYGREALTLLVSIGSLPCDFVSVPSIVFWYWAAPRITNH